MIQIGRLERSAMRSVYQNFLVAFVLGLMIVATTGASCGSNPSSSKPVSTSSVSIKNTAFDPISVSVSAGSVITWTNNDSVYHQIITDSNLPDLESGVLDSGATYSFTFSQTGTFPYHCNIHPEMKGQVTVK